ncbi:MAG: hypothetical protein K2Q15_16165 [Burkholderiales bacterium]|nr:hypothetical protein [Burkholderiales bacterium]
MAKHTLRGNVINEKQAIAHSRIEIMLAISGSLSGLLVACFIAAKNDYFYSNLQYYWGSQLLVLACLAPLRPRPAIVAGAGLFLAFYLGCFHTWVFSMVRPESMLWIIYFFSLAGAALTMMLGAYWQHRQPQRAIWLSAGLSALHTMAGLGLGVLVLAIW